MNGVSRSSGLSGPSTLNQNIDFNKGKTYVIAHSCLVAFGKLWNNLPSYIQCGVPAFTAICFIVSAIYVSIPGMCLTGAILCICLLGRQQADYIRQANRNFAEILKKECADINNYLLEKKEIFERYYNEISEKNKSRWNLEIGTDEHYELVKEICANWKVDLNSFSDRLATIEKEIKTYFDQIGKSYDPIFELVSLRSKVTDLLSLFKLNKLDWEKDEKRNKLFIEKLKNLRKKMTSSKNSLGFVDLIEKNRINIEALQRSL